MKLADPIDRAVAMVVRKDRLHEPPQSVGARMLEAAMCREAGIPEPTPITKRERVAKLIYSFDQDFINRAWHKLGATSRETYLEIADAVIAEVDR